VTQRTQDDRSPDSSPAPEAGDPNDRGDAKKERVLHTRIPEVLDKELKTAAKALRVPVSNLVRTILEDAVAIADRATGNVEQGLNRAARSVQRERERLRDRIKPPNPLEEVVAFQPVIVAAQTRCARCEAALEPGDDAGVGVTDEPGPKLFVCSECLPKRGGAATQKGAKP
jgi:hypothetical protein